MKYRTMKPRGRMEVNNMAGLYTMTAVDNALDKLMRNGYDIFLIPGTLIDSYVCVPDTDMKWIYEFRETPLNAWSSAYTVRRHSKMSKRLQDLISQAE